MRDTRFLKKRQTKLREYETIKKNNLKGVFTSYDNAVSKGNLEEQFDFEATVLLIDETPANVPLIRIRICSIGQVLEFAKDVIVIGRGQTCVMVLNQPPLSSFQAKVYWLSDDEYILEDVNAHNGTFTTSMNQQFEPRHNKIIRATDNVVSNTICGSFLMLKILRGVSNFSFLVSMLITYN